MDQTNPRLAPRLRLGCGLLAAVVLVGTVGFHLIEGWTPIEALFTTVLVVSTLGFADLRPGDVPGQLLTLALIGAGVGTLYYLVGALAQSLIETQLNRGRRREMGQQIARLRDHVIVCGYGRVGQATCKSLTQQGTPFIVVDSDPQRIATIQAAGYLCLAGDASDDAVLRQAGVERARALLTAVHSDAANVYITLSARALNPRLLIVARAVMPEAMQKLRIAGANRVLSPYELGGRSMAVMALRPAVMDFLDILIHSDDLEMWLEEVYVGPESALAGLCVGETRLREEAGITILAVRRADGQMIVNPPPETAIEQGDTLIALGARH